ncbi:hypothetical protein [Neisseria shayeganii]|uniref:IRF tryptophan pentad repeat domain-containing protein n=1 Tax=Neisseria shayeganii TaxID=607712 RepID=A0A7D7SHE0_9NEIS|nr:hypothetical protein [Neisseria shayeganii]QMT39987.1 hypothetical protein H3L94_09025 [Neisseria shayeganii]
MRERIRHFLVYRDWCTASVIWQDGLGRLQPRPSWLAVWQELHRMRADGELLFDERRMCWRLPLRPRTR